MSQRQNNVIKRCQKGKFTISLKYKEIFHSRPANPISEVIKLFSCSTQLNVKFIIFIYISMIDIYESLKAKNSYITCILAWEFVTQRCLKPQNPCSNHEIHVLFEHGFYLKRPKLGPDLYA